MRLLIIEDSSRLQTSLKDGFTHFGFAVDVCGNGLEGLDYLAAYDYDVVVLDLMLPGLDGLSVLKKMRKAGNTSQVIILSAKDQLDDRITGLDLGADDYLIKPFAFEELLARVRTLVRRQYDHKTSLLEIGPIILDLNAMSVSRNGKRLPLSTKEFSLLRILALRRNQVVTRDMLLDHLYHGESDIGSNVIDVMVCHVRKKIELNGERLIRTVRGFGYVME